MTAARTSPGDRADRREQLLDAAIMLIAERGLRGLTHRALQDAAGMKHGSVAYYFKTRDQLVLAVLDRLIKVEVERSATVVHEAIRALAARSAASDYEHLAGLLRSWWTESHELLLARFELELAGARDPAIRNAMSRCGTQFRELAELIALAAGSTNPALDAEIFVRHVDGLMFDFVTRPTQDPQILSIGLRRAAEAIASA